MPEITQETPEQIYAHEFSAHFVELMRNRMLQSFFKYGPVAETKGRVDKLTCCAERVKRYRETGNKEWLVDAANFLMMEFMVPEQDAYFQATSAVESPGRARLDDGRRRDPNKIAGNES